MKIGILTFHCADNYGAVLQAFALYQKLTELSSENEVFIVDYRPDSITKTYSLIKFGNISNFIRSLIQLPFSFKRKLMFDMFRKKYFKLIDINDINKIDYLICGSDQIWNPNITRNIDPYYFGIIKGFLGKTVTYAASDGGYLDTINDKILREYLAKITALSVREPTMLPLLEQYKQDISVVLDPVFLLDKKIWEIIASKRKYQNYILIYCTARNDKILQDAYTLSKLKGFKVIEITYGFLFKKIFVNKQKILPCTSIPDFLSYFFYAEYVFTDSFHGTAFSIIFNKNFFSYRLNDKRNDRIHTILSAFDLTNRYGNCFNTEILNDIDYHSVNTYMVQKRNISISFLMKALLCQP